MRCKCLLAGCLFVLAWAAWRCVFWQCLLSLTLGAALLYTSRRDRRLPPSPHHVLVVTGCDTGLGFTLALHARHLGMTVVAGCLDALGPGAQMLRAVGVRTLQIDVTDKQSVRAAVDAVKLLLDENPLLQLKALVNNAAVMVFGEFEWQTERQIRHQVEVNLLGTMRVTHMFCSLLRKSQGRIIIVSSHCAAASLPGLAPYGATKGALKNWADSLRVEQAKYGVEVVSFIPGSFINKSSIMARHNEHAREMEAAMTPEDAAFFGDYFHTFHAYLSGLSVSRDQPRKIEDPALLDLFEAALLSCHPRPSYLNQPPRYAVYHLLFKVTPTWLRDRLVQRFVQMPEWWSSEASST